MSTYGLPELLTVREVATRLGLKERAVRRLLFKGTIYGTKIGGQWRIREIDLPKKGLPAVTADTLTERELEFWTPLDHPKDFLDLWLGLATPEKVGMLRDELQQWYNRIHKAWERCRQGDEFVAVLKRVCSEEVK